MKQIFTLIVILNFGVLIGQNWYQIGLDIDGEAAGDSSGSVSINSAGDRVAIGAPFNKGNGEHAGHVRIYEWSGTSWAQLGSDIDGEAVYNNCGNSVSMNSAGDRLAIGAYNNDGSGYNAGHVRIYEWNGTVWVQLGLDIDGDTIGDNLGRAVSMNALGDRIAIGADVSNAATGHVRVYEWSGTTWVQLGLDIDGEAAGDYSGSAVSINSVGDRVAIGATFNDGNGTGVYPDYRYGHVRVYEWNGTGWVQLGLDIDGEAAGDYSGGAVSINSVGDKVAIGASLNDGNSSGTGHVRIYEWNGTDWVQLVADIDGEAYGNNFGRSVSINSAGDRVAIGAALNDGNGIDAGHVRIYNDCSYFLSDMFQDSIMLDQQVMSLTAFSQNLNYQWLNCDSNYAVIPNETNQVFNPSVNGNYAVEISCLGFADTTSCINFTFLGLDESPIQYLTIFPNPLNKYTRVQLPSEPHTLAIYDIIGNKVREEQVRGTTIIERGDLTKGIYVLEVRSESKTYSGRLVVE